jgi:hypothetical protein
VIGTFLLNDHVARRTVAPPLYSLEK